MRIEDDHITKNVWLDDKRKITVTIGCENNPQVIVDHPFVMGTFDQWIEYSSQLRDALKRIKADVSENPQTVAQSKGEAVRAV